MIRIPYAEMITKIQEKTGLSQEDVEAKIKDKLTQLSGLISKEGAAHIIANELGVNAFHARPADLERKDIKFHTKEFGKDTIESIKKLRDKCFALDSSDFRVFIINHFKLL